MCINILLETVLIYINSMIFSKCFTKHISELFDKLVSDFELCCRSMGIFKKIILNVFIFNFVREAIESKKGNTK